jgi:V/A-type H+/Na+-transporting ATPase subunit C
MTELLSKRTFPYAYARVSAMKAKLIPRNDYPKLLKMDLASITRYLQESEYKAEISKLGMKYSGMELVDRAIRQNQAKTYEKLRRICPNDVTAVIDLFLERWDFQNLKVVLRGIYSNALEDDVLSLIEPVGKYKEEHFKRLFEAGSIEKALSMSKIVEDKDLKLALEKYKESNRLIELENILDKLYFAKAIRGAERLPEHGREFKEFLLQDIDVVNIRNLIRFRKENIDKQAMMALMLIEGLRLEKKHLEALTSSDSLEQLLSKLKKTYYGKHIAFEGDTTIIDLQLRNFQYKRAFMGNIKPLSVETILSFMIRKLIEIRNIRSLVKAKHLRIDEAYVEKNLLVT